MIPIVPQITLKINRSVVILVRISELPSYIPSVMLAEITVAIKNKRVVPGKKINKTI